MRVTVNHFSWDPGTHHQYPACRVDHGHRHLKALKNRIDAYTFIEDVEGGGLTNPLEAFRFAFRMHPETIYMLTDGEFDEKVCDAVKKMNQERSPSNRIKILTIAFEERRGDYVLNRLARESGGRFRFVP